MKINKPHLVFEGEVYGRLTVLGYSHNDKRWRRHYLVRCSCGTEKTVQGTLLRSGNTSSCGCLSLETKKKARLPNNSAAITTIILQYKRHARDRDIEWCLPRSDVELIVRKPCRYCGDPAGNVTRSRAGVEFWHNGIDRVDPRRGYHSDNVVPCCGRCNIAKRDFTETDFLAWARRVAEHTACADQWSQPDLVQMMEAAE